MDRRAALHRASSAALPLFAPLFSFFGRPSAAGAAASSASAADAASEPAMFYSGATGKENYMTAFTASSNTNVSPKEAYDTIYAQLAPKNYLAPEIVAAASRPGGAPLRALDLGAGAGVSTEMLWKLGYRDVHAVDWSDAAWREWVKPEQYDVGGVGGAGVAPSSGGSWFEAKKSRVTFYAMDDQRFLDLVGASSKKVAEEAAKAAEVTAAAAAAAATAAAAAKAAAAETAMASAASSSSDASSLPDTAAAAAPTMTTVALVAERDVPSPPSSSSSSSSSADDFKFDAIVFNYACNSGKAKFFAQNLLKPGGRLVAPCNRDDDYWLKQEYRVLDSDGAVVWRAGEVGAWDVVFQPDMTEESCQAVRWCPETNNRLTAVEQSFTRPKELAYYSAASASSATKN